MQPTQIRDTSMPVFPSFVYSIVFSYSVSFYSAFPAVLLLLGLIRSLLENSARSFSWRGDSPSKPPRDAHYSSRFRITQLAFCACGSAVLAFFSLIVFALYERKNDQHMIET